ncbi:MAG: hypothetical protein WCK26_03895 [Candidatus Saccharibacteria bacterium]
MIDYRDKKDCDRDKVTFQADDSDDGEDKIRIMSLIRQSLLARIGQVKQSVPGQIFNPVTAIPTPEGADFYVVPDMYQFLKPDFVYIAQECVDEVLASQV